ncbi:TIGR03792 family protein [Synechococcus sp. RSCCF101]|uniref:TIGR03792 family protein n=1 Tax=Synechococcus sp. RSCCF101 TaxID=2511069 RepID=UPI001246C1AA|nr:TIGR03792 family protein [Synechococcus sp. RSCCF101]QEY33412.1 TIGR03792 family protein [Synechococcus sp. RSCCF101]
MLAGPDAPPPARAAEVQVVEQLNLRVPARFRAVWLEAEAATWEPWLADQEGFLGRDLLWDPEREEGVLLIRWASRSQWKAIPAEEVEQVQQEFERTVRAILARDPEPGPAAAGTGDQAVLDLDQPFPLIREGELQPLRTTPPPTR